MLKKILITVAAVLAVLVVMISRQPDHFEVSRSTVINAPANVIFPHVNNLHQWNDWSPWAKMDPNAKMTFEGPEAGVNASNSWAGNSEVGEGKMTIVDVRENEMIKIKLEFFKPMTGVNDTLFTFTPEGNGTKITWTMSGPMNFISKAFSLVMDCEKMVGPQFEKGLASMKAIAESATSK